MESLPGPMEITGVTVGLLLTLLYSPALKAFTLWLVVWTFLFYFSGAPVSPHCHALPQWLPLLLGPWNRSTGLPLLPSSAWWLKLVSLYCVWGSRWAGSRQQQIPSTLTLGPNTSSSPHSSIQAHGNPCALWHRVSLSLFSVELP